jgi:hypothetical protein
MEETLTVHRLHVPMQLRKTLASTNVIDVPPNSVSRCHPQSLFLLKRANPGPPEHGQRLAGNADHTGGIREQIRRSKRSSPTCK